MSGAELLRSVGLFVDGPARWSQPVPSRAPGVFVVELPGGREQAPIDHLALRRWLEQVPDLRLDGERPTPHRLAARLAAFWLPGESVLYVGRTARALGPHVTATYATRLGDARPGPQGHWLRTLAPLDQLLVWWAETNAPQEYQDALLSEVAARTDAAIAAGLHDPDVVLPFANLETATGEPKRHGLTGALRESAQPAPRPIQKAAPSAAARPAQPRRRPASARMSAPGSASSPPAPDPSYLSADGVARLQSELDELRTAVRPEVVARVKSARELGDLRENAEYESARREQSFVEGRIQALEALLRSAVLIESEPAQAGGAVTIGSTVTVEMAGDTQTYQIVGSAEADPAGGRISHLSPIGGALLGRRVGEEAVARLPRGEIRLVVRDIS